MIVIGDKIIDNYIFGTSTRLSPEAPVPVLTNLKEETRCGGAQNVVKNLNSFGIDTVFIHNPNQKTVKTRIIANGHIVCRLDDEYYIPYKINFDFDLSKHDYAIISDYGKGVVDDPISIIKTLNAAGIKVLVDPKKPFSAYRGAWLIKANKTEFESIYGTFSWNNFSMICEDICTRYGFSYVIVTLGAEGFALYDHDKKSSRYEKGEEHTVVDVTGAGDVFMATLAYFIQSMSVSKAAHRANVLAGYSVGHMGTYIVTKDDIDTVKPKVNTVFTNGCFDILHPGHINLLKESKKLGRKLIVGINSDASIHNIKGFDRPILNQNQRKIMLEALGIADEVIIFDEDTPYQLIKRIRPDIITKGGDYTIQNVVGNDLANVVIIPTIDNYSTTGVIDAIKRKN